MNEDFNKVDLLKLWFWKKVRIKILTDIKNFTFHDYHNIYRRNIKWFYICTIWSWKCFCCEESIQKKNAVLVKVYCYEFRKCCFMLLNYFHIQEIKKAITYWKDPTLRNDFIIWRWLEKDWWQFYFYRTKNCSLNDFHIENIREDRSMSLNRAYDLISLPLDSIKQAFFDEFSRLEENKWKENDFVQDKTINDIYSEIKSNDFWLKKIVKWDFVYQNDKNELSIHKNDTSVVEKQFEQIDSLEERIKKLKMI